MMQKWEYDYVSRTMMDSLFRKKILEMGQLGWKLVTIVEQEIWIDFNHTLEQPVTLSDGATLAAYLKRPIE